MYTFIQKAARILHIIDSLFKIQNPIYASSFSFDIDLLLCAKVICDCVTLQFNTVYDYTDLDFLSRIHELQNFPLLFYFILALFNKYTYSNYYY